MKNYIDHKSCMLPLLQYCKNPIFFLWETLFIGVDLYVHAKYWYKIILWLFQAIKKSILNVKNI